MVESKFCLFHGLFVYIGLFLVDTDALETMKKGTPLYGQPSWWGDEEPSPDDSVEQKTKPTGNPSSLPGRSELQVLYSHASGAAISFAINSGNFFLPRVMLR